MKVTKEKVENSQAYLTVEMEPPEIEEGLDKAYRRLVQKANIPGFRKGKAPRNILERYVGKEGLLEDAINHMVPTAYEKAIKEQNIEAVAQPEIEILKTEPVTFKAVVPLNPTVDLGDYKSVRVPPESTEVKEEEIKNVLDGVLHQHATWEAVDRPVEFNDAVIMDVDSTVEDKPFIQQKAAQYQVLKDFTAPLPGFAEQLVGMKKGDTKEFKLPFPADYPREGFAGKEANFKVTINEVKQERLPELTDDLAKKVDESLANVDALRERVTKHLKLRAEQRARLALEEKAVDAAASGAKVEYPPVLVEIEIDRMINDQARRLQLDARGLEEYLKGIKKTGEELRNDLRPMAQKRVTRALVLDKIAETEKIAVAESEIDAEIKGILDTTGDKNREQMEQYLNNPRSRESIKSLLLRRKTIERLAEMARSAPSTPAEAKEEKQ